MAKIKKFKFMIITVQIQFIRAILGRLYAIFALIKCIRLFKFNAYGYKFYRLAIPKLERWVE